MGFVGPSYEIGCDSLGNSTAETALSLDVEIPGRRLDARVLAVGGNNKRRFILGPHYRICLGAVRTFHIHFDFVLPVNRVVEFAQDREILRTASTFVAFFHREFILDHKHGALKNELAVAERGQAKAGGPGET